jgi:hypothetical protein
MSTHACEKKWKDIWRTHIGPKVLNPRAHLRLALVPSVAQENCRAVSGLSDVCIRIAIDHLVDDGAFNTEEIIVTKAVDGILELFPLD